jgi:PAS domain S-box-containing protein
MASDPFEYFLAEQQLQNVNDGNTETGLGSSLQLGELDVSAPLPASQPPIMGPPVPTNFGLGTDDRKLTGLYSSSGFDMATILAKIVSRPNPQINIGPIDMSCSFLVTDARQYDFPIVYVSPTFEKLTSYKTNEIIGRNCRFLQSPDGHVSMGSRRRFTDNNAVFHIKTHMLQGKESQASLINYRKGGQVCILIRLYNVSFFDCLTHPDFFIFATPQPFINLITIIPITWYDDEVAFFVGLQVDLVEQPDAIMEKMKDGTYHINYQSYNIPPYLPGAFEAPEVDQYFRDIPTSTPFPASEEVFDLIDCRDDQDKAKSIWNKLLLDQCDDFVHVLSLKGLFLYCSPASIRLLEYEPEELIGRSLSTICHPSDIIPVIRELKEASHGEVTVNLVYRVRRKHSGIMWMEAQGRVHIEQGKGRKCVILSGRERPVYRLVWNDIMSATSLAKEQKLANSPNDSRYASSSTSYKGLSHNEFWSKLSIDGLILYTTGSSQRVLGLVTDALVGTSLYQVIPRDRTNELSLALREVREGKTVNLMHKLRNNGGEYVMVQSTLYPGDITNGVGRPTFIVMQTRDVKSPPPSFGSSSSHNSGSSLPSTSSPIEEVASDDPITSPQDVTTRASWQESNIFEELEPVRGTSWQFELHQLRLTNRKLKEELDALTSNDGKKNRNKKHEDQKICAQCHRKDSPEWRRGPNGPKELCNACGLRYKSMHKKAHRLQGQQQQREMGNNSSFEPT